MRYKITKKDAEVLLFSVILQNIRITNMILRKITSLLALLSLSLGAFAGIDIQATYTDKSGVEATTTDNFTAEAPLHVMFTWAATSIEEGLTPVWHFRHRTSSTNVTRYESDTEYTFTEAGINVVILNLCKNDEVLETDSMLITITESQLEMPNAFSPNDDGINDVYRAKQDKYKSIVEFHAYIFNRHGQKLYEWTDITKGWDGKYNGSPVKDGVYFVYVKARGADGVEYNIRRDVNLIRDHNQTTSSSSNE